ncbi:hypothetical protein [Spiroplasma endosymbiont of Nebria brevicollis]|uniref:hypothetical protein n=1 Tax=Spiroplasma endosymbiont of Nebria brevicollis TaxID=3066284 RepID=UPI00313D155F
MLKTTAIVKSASSRLLFFNVANLTTTPLVELDPTNPALVDFYALSETTDNKTFYFQYK